VFAAAARKLAIIARLAAARERACGSRSASCQLCLVHEFVEVVRECCGTISITGREKTLGSIDQVRLAPVAIRLEPGGGYEERMRRLLSSTERNNR
jgi:hypothetical protein